MNKISFAMPFAFFLIIGSLLIYKDNSTVQPLENQYNQKMIGRYALLNASYQQHKFNGWTVSFDEGKQSEFVGESSINNSQTSEQHYEGKLVFSNQQNETDIPINYSINDNKKLISFSIPSHNDEKIAWLDSIGYNNQKLKNYIQNSLLERANMISIGKA